MPWEYLNLFFTVAASVVMAYTPIRSGFTGPSAKIGGSSDYHIDLKMLESLPIGERVKAVDTLAKKYASIGREIEFSNEGVAGQRWNPEADLATRVDLLNRAAAAHSKRPGWQSLDFYVPFKGKSRFDKGAVEDASIFLPGVAGGSVRRGTAKDYGYFSESLDPKGNVLFRVGHGNIDRPEANENMVISQLPQKPSTPPLQQTVSSQDNLAAYRQGLFDALGMTQPQQKEKEKPSLTQSLLSGVLANAFQGNPFMRNYMQQNPYMQGRSQSTADFLSGLLG